VLANKWRYYEKKAKEIDDEYRQAKLDEYSLDSTNTEKNTNGKTIEEKAYKKDLLDSLGCFKTCCRRHLISHVDMMGKI
jgi:DNA-directed RNA polymerase subunit N (RpoN/RPB10)